MADPSGEALVAFVRWVIRWRWAVLVVSIVATLGIARGGRFLEFDNNYRAFFGKENPQLSAFEALERIYTKNDNILFIIHPRGGDVFTKEVLTAIKELTDAAWKIPYSIRVDSLTNFQHTRAEGEDDLIVEDLVRDPQSLEDGDLERVRSIAQREPLLRIRMVSEDSSTAGLNVRLQVPRKSLTELPEAAAYARRLRADLRAKYPELEIRLSGSGMLGNAFAEAPQLDMKILIPVMYGILIAAMLLFFRSLTATVAMVAVVAFSVLVGMGVAGWLGIRLTGVSASAPTIILTLGVADSVHILVTMFAELRRGSSRQDALVESLRVNAQPVFLTSLTTAIGFLSLNFSDAPPLRDLGKIDDHGADSRIRDRAASGAGSRYGRCRRGAHGRDSTLRDQRSARGILRRAPRVSTRRGLRDRAPDEPLRHRLLARGG
jgi:predicted RND superfamily exporter protein